MILEIINSLVICTLGYLFWKSWKSNRILSSMPGPKKWPLVGNGLDFLEGPEHMTRIGNQYIAKYGRRIRINLGLSALVFIVNANDAEKILTSQKALDKSPEYEMIEAWLGTGILTSKAVKWRGRRKLINNAFHFKLMENFVPIINEQSQTLIHVLQPLADASNFDVAPLITNAGLDIICETAMGCKIQAQQNSSLYSDYINAVHQETELYIKRVFQPWLHPELVWKFSPSGHEEARLIQILHGFTERVIKERKDSRNQMTSSSVTPEGSGRSAFLDSLLDLQDKDPEALTDKDLREEVDTFMFAGHDTSAVNICWVLLLLGSHPEHQTRVVSELNSIFGSDRTRPIQMEDLRHMEYLDLCIKESLRLFPSVPSIVRHITSPVKLDEETILPAGVSAWIYLQGLHRDPKEFDSPNEFIPERFTPENSVGRHPYAYIPFSAGPRNCLGQKFAMIIEKIILADILRNYQVEAVDRWNKVKLLTAVVLRPKDGVRVRLLPRP